MQENKLYLAVLHSLWISHKKIFSIFNDNLFKIEKDYKIFYEKLNKEELEKFWFKNNEISSILKRKKELQINYIKQKLEEREVEIIICDEEKYPVELKNISNSPYLIYVRWKISTWPKIAVVGSRNITSYFTIFKSKFF